MKYLMRPIEVQIWMDREGRITPIKFRVEENQGEVEIEVVIDRILQVNEQKVAGHSIRSFDCQTNNGQSGRRCMIQCHLSECRWYLVMW